MGSFYGYSRSLVLSVCTFYSISEEHLSAITIAAAAVADLSRVMFRGRNASLGKAGKILVRAELLMGERAGEHQQAICV